MSLYDYRKSLVIEAQGYPFHALVMALIRQADDRNLEKLKRAFPEIYEELMDRYMNPGGVLPEERALER